MFSLQRSRKQFNAGGLRTSEVLETSLVWLREFCDMAPIFHRGGRIPIRIKFHVSLQSAGRGLPCRTEVRRSTS